MPDQLARVPGLGRALAALARLLETHDLLVERHAGRHVAHHERDMGGLREGRGGHGYWIQTVLALTNDCVPKLASSRP